jgi:hypothetical protein
MCVCKYGRPFARKTRLILKGFSWNFTWVVSKILHTVCFLFKNEFILQNTFTSLQCNLHFALSQRSNVWASLVILSGRLHCWCVWLLRSPHYTPPQCFWSVSHGVVSWEQVKVWWAYLLLHFLTNSYISWCTSCYARFSSPAAYSQSPLGRY